MYLASNFGKKEEELINKFNLQLEDAKLYFKSCIKPRLDRSYKLYIAYNGDRAKEIQRWQNNISVPYIQAVIETLVPRILDARPEFIAQGRKETVQEKAVKQQYLNDYTWEISDMDDTLELVVRASLILGTGFLQPSWKKDVREYKFLKSRDLNKKRFSWGKKKITYYDAPFAEWVDNYNLWYDWHNVEGKSKQFWFKRKILTGAEIKRQYPMHDKRRLELAFNSNNSDLTDYGSIRYEVKQVQEKIIKGADYNVSGFSSGANLYQNQNDPDLKMYEIFEWWRPFEDSYAVMVGGVPILKNGDMPNPYDFKDAPFISIPYLKMLNEFEGYGLPMILESPQIMLNLIKNQRLDAVTMNIHKMWIVNPLANIRKEELVIRPLGIIYTPDTSAVREVEFSDVKASAYREEETLKGDMRYTSGVDDFSMGAGGSAGSATEVRHLRESTLERVRMFVNHLGKGCSELMRYWMSMYRQFFTEKMTIRIIGDDGNPIFPLIEKDDLMGEFDYKALVLPSIAGQNEVTKKQNMDLFQLLINLPFVDPQKLTSKILHPWNWSLNSVSKGEEQAMGMEGMEPGAATEATGAPAEMLPTPTPGLRAISPEMAQAILGGGYQGQGNMQSPIKEAAMPINLLEGGLPPTPQGVPMPTANPRGFSRGGGGKVNTNISLKPTSSEAAKLLNRSANIQR